MVLAIVGRGRGEPVSTPLATTAAVITGAGLLLMVGTGLTLTRRAKKTLSSLEIGRAVEPDLAAIRRIESARLPATAQWSEFPTVLRASREIDSGHTPIRFAANIPSLRPRGKGKPMEIAASYVWFAIPHHLPRIVIAEDSGALRAMSRDVDIESEAFNRRFHVAAGPGLSAAAHEAGFGRYASALIHPRAAQCLLRLPQGFTAVVDGERAGAIDSVMTSRERIEQIAEVLTELVSLAPAHVLRQWAGQDSYTPRTG